MAENINKRPSKSILKSAGSVEREQPTCSKRAKEQRFDEMNILATLHPPDKDYGHMKIDEPKTPFSEYEDPTLELRHDEVDASLLAAKLNAREPPPEPDERDDETPEERRVRLEFEKKRKNHYNEFQAIQLARKLMEEEEEDDDEDNAAKETARPEDEDAEPSSSPPRAQVGFMQNKRDAEKSKP